MKKIAKIIFPVFFILSAYQTFVKAGPLNGMYTIGTGEIYETPADAVDSLIANGISGPVTFNIKDGTYPQQLSIPEIAGSSSVNTITFQSQSGDSTKVAICFSANSTNNYTLKLDGAKYIKFHCLKFQALNSSYSRVIDLRNNVDHITFSHCILQGVTTSNTNDSRAIVYNNSSENSFISFTNNSILNGSIGIYAYNSNFSYGWTIDNNIFDNQYYMSLYLGHMNSLVISKNIMTTNFAYYPHYVIRCYSCNNLLKIEKNKFYAPAGGYVIYLENCMGRDTTKGIIANNFIQTGGTGVSYGIYFYLSDYQQVYNNNIHVTSSSTGGGRALYIGSGSHVELKNNILANTGGGYALYVASPSSLDASDYNDLFTTGTNLAYWSTDIKNLKSLQSASGQELHSVSLNPFYNSTTDLHVREIWLKGAGTLLPDIVDDIDGEERNAANPAIGADEFTLPQTDAGIYSLASPKIPFPLGNNNIIAILRNCGSDTLKTVAIDWSVNNVQQTRVNWPGVLPSGDTAYVQLGTYTFSPNTQYSVKAWSYLPDDLFNYNDSYQASNLYTALSDSSYTIGGNSPDFTSFQAAVNTLKLGGIMGNVVFNVRNGTYPEQISIPEITGTSESATITFQSETQDSLAVNLSHSTSLNNNYIIQLNGADHIIFHQLTLATTSNGEYGRIVDIQNHADHNIFSSCILKGSPSGYSENGAVIYSPNSVNDYNLFKNNKIQNGSYGVYYRGAAYNTLDKGTMIENNTFESQNNCGISIQYQDSAIIRTNTINLSAGTNISCTYCNNTLVIEKNKLIVPNGSRGIELSNCKGLESTQGLISNNFIQVGGTGTAFGIRLYNSDYQKIYNNNIHITAGSTGNEYALYISEGEHIDLKNNILANTGGGYSLYVNSVPGFYTSDNNDLYTTGRYLAYYSTDVATLKDLQAVSNQDINSVSCDPLFVTVSDLHVRDSWLNGKAISLADVTDDIDGEIRDNLKPDIGADEFTPIQTDAAVVSLVSPQTPFISGDNDIIILLKNNGAVALDSVIINWEINGKHQTGINWKGPLSTGDTLQVRLGSYLFDTDSAYTIKSWVSMPNGQADIFNINDTILATGLWASLSDTLTIGGTDPDYSTFGEAVEDLIRCGIISTVVYKVRNDTFNEQIIIPEIKGASENARIIFEPETGDSTRVILTNTENSDNYCVLLLNGAKYITFRRMTISTNGNYYKNAVNLGTHSSYNRFESNIIKGASLFDFPHCNGCYLPSEEQGCLILIEQDNNYNTFLNNRFEFGTVGIFTGYSGGNGKGNIIKNNSFKNQYNGGIGLQNQDSLIISSNMMRVTDVPSGDLDILGYYGIECSNCNNQLKIEKNRIYTSYGICGIKLSECHGNNLSQGIISNNFIGIEGIDYVDGIDLLSCGYQKIYNNSISIVSSENSTALYVNSGNNISILNNIMTNTGGNALIINHYEAIDSSDYNDLYTTGLHLALWGDTVYTNLEDLKSATGKEIHSVSIDPVFISSTNLHTHSVLLDNKGTPVPEITDDIDGDQRDLLNPDIGADEFDTLHYDAGVLSLAAPQMPFKGGNNDIVVILRNYGFDTLRSVTVQWSVNGGTVTNFPWTGKLGTSDTTYINIGSYNFTGNTGYTIKCWTSMPNGSSDGENLNDTIKEINIYPRLDGHYTIGSTNSDFQSFTGALNILYKAGIGGNVTFGVLDGTYKEQLDIQYIPGLSSDTTLTFESESGDSSQVILTCPDDNPGSDYIIQLDSASYITLRGMTITPLNFDNAHVIYIRNGSTHNTFANCIIQGTSSSDYVIYSDGSNNSYNIFTNNRILNGDHGLYDPGMNQDNLTKGTVIEGNLFENQNNDAIYMRYHDSLSIIGNSCTTNGVTDEASSIYCTNCSNQIIDKNKISLLFGRYGILVSGCTGTESSPGIISNNFIRIPATNGTADCKGIHLGYSDYQGIYNNTVNVGSAPGSESSALYLHAANNIDIKNNILIHSGGGYAIYSNLSVDSSDYNNLFTTGNYLCYYNDSKVPNMEVWRLVTKTDSNSLSINPSFVSESDLHVNNIAFYHAGAQVAYVTDDIDGDARNITSPCIGADEFFPTKTDVGILDDFHFGRGLQDVTVKIMNFGADTLTSARIDWEFNDTLQSPFDWGDTLTPGQSAEVILGQKYFDPSSQYSITVWTSQPNNVQDLNTANDTLMITGAYPALSGEYKIGGITPDFDYFYQAVDALSNYGIAGKVTFMVRDHTYPEQISIPEIDGAEEPNSITFRSENGDSSNVVLSFTPTSDANYIVQLNGASGVTFEKIKLQSNGFSFSRIIDIRDKSNNNRFLNNVLEGSDKSGNSTNHELVYSENSSTSNNEFTNNVFKNGSYGIYSSGQDFPVYGLKILGNKFIDQSIASISLQYASNTIITDNTIDGKGIQLRYCSNNISVAGNTMSLNSGNGIYLLSCNGNKSITRNKIINNDGNGIYMGFSNGLDSDPGLMANNFIYIDGYGTGYGMYFSFSSNYTIYNNNINISGTDSKTGLYLYYSDNIDFLNNIVSSSSSGYLLFKESSSYNFTSNYNDLYTANGVTGSFNSNDINTLAEWQTETNNDSNSVSVNPHFYSNTDLHVNEIKLDRAAKPLVQITDDIDGEPRDMLQPDIGADEFTPLRTDAGVIAFNNPVKPFIQGSQEIKILVRNFGSDTIKNVQIGWTFNDVPQNPVPWNKPIAPGDSVLVSLGEHTFGFNINHKIKSWTFLPNDVQDNFNLNDTIQVTGIYAALKGDYTIGGASPDFTKFNYAVNALINGGIVDSVHFNVRDNTYYEQIIIPSIQGAGALNSIVFESENKDSTKVTLYHPGSSFSDNYVVRLEGASGVTFKHLTIKNNSSSSYGRVIDITGTSENNCFLNNLIQNSITSSSEDNASLIYSKSANTSRNKFIGNYFKNGSYGIFYSASSCKNFILSNNIFENQYCRAVNLDNLLRPEIRGNKITSTSTYSSYSGFYLSHCDSGLVCTGNIITVNSGKGIHVEASIGIPANQGLIANNFIRAAGSSSSQGIYCTSVNYLNIYHNSVLLTNNNSASSAIYLNNNSGNINVKNNIFDNAGNGYSIVINNGSSLSGDYNDLYTHGTYLGKWLGIDIADITGWQTASNCDQNSLSIDPQFVSSTDLHVSEIALNEAGTPLEITMDIDGELRDTLHPDIGADEFTPSVARDAGVTAIINPKVPFPVGDNQIKAVIRNFGTDTLTSVFIDLMVNQEALDSVLWQGSLAPKATDTVTIATYGFIKGQPYIIKAWTFSPNDVADQNTINDTSVVSDLYAALNGYYTIGGDDPDFVSLTDAVTSISKGGILGKVTFNIANGTYYEQLLLHEITGADSLHTITFQPRSIQDPDVNIEFEGSINNNYVIKLDGVNYIRFKGLNLKNSNDTYGKVIDLSNQASHNVFENNVLECIVSKKNDYRNSILVNSSGSYYDVFENNHFINGSYGLCNEVNSTVKPRNSTIARSNVFENQDRGAVYLKYQNSPVIEKNVISSQCTNNISAFIKLEYCNNSILIVKNKISGCGKGISLNYCNGDLNNTGLIANNFIRTGGSVNVDAIYLGNSNYQNIYNNSILVDNSDINSAGVYFSTGNNINIYNNIIFNQGGGLTLNSPNGDFFSDNNDLFTTGTVLASYNSLNYNNISEWRYATSRDNNSLSVDPLYYSLTDLHVNEITLGRAGTPLAIVTDDIDDEPRGTIAPCIGADEFKVTEGYDAGITALISPSKPFPAGTNAVYAVIRNFCMKPIHSLFIEWSVNDVLQDPYYWSDTLVPGIGTDTVNIGNYDFTANTYFNIKIWTRDPENIVDSLNKNDTIRVSNLCPALNGDYTLGGLIDPDYSDFSEAVKFLVDGGVTGAVNFNVDEGTYTEQIEIPAITGVDSLKPVTFQSINNDTSDVKLMFYPTSSSNNYVVKLNGAKYISFRNITLRNTADNFSRVVYLTNDANLNVFEGNNIEALSNKKLSNTNALVYIDNSTLYQNTFTRNHLKGSSIGIFANKNSGMNNTQITIAGNKFTDQYSRGICLINQYAPVISENSFFYNSGNTYGLYLESCSDRIIISKNKILLNNGSTGIYLYYSNGNNTGKALIENNFIAVGNNGINGINLYHSNYFNIYNNSIHVFSNGGNAIYEESGSNFDITDNIIINSGGGYALNFNSLDAISNSDYNDIYSTGTILANINGTGIATLSEWKSITNNDDHSVSIDPMFVSPVDLHVTEVRMDNKGKPLAEVTDDIDYESRDAITPDIGADEFTMPLNDAGVLSVNYPEIPFEPGLRDIVVTLKNYGANSLADVDINWSINGNTPRVFNWTGTILPGESDTLTIGQYDFSQFIQYNILTWTSNPNGNNDVKKDNDTANVNSLCPALNGTYYIGGTNPHFNTFTEAVNALNTGGILGPVNFLVRSGTYPEQFQINQISGASAGNQVIFSAASGDSTAVIITGPRDQDSSIITLRDARYITFKRLTIRQSNNSDDLIRIISGSDNTFIHNRIEGLSDFNTQTILVSSENSGRNKFINNLFGSGNTALDLKGISDSRPDSGIVVNQNIFENQIFKAVHLQYHNAPEITGNTIRSGLISMFTAIDIQNCKNDTRVTKNKINIGEGGGYGVSLHKCSSSVQKRALVSNNSIAINGSVNTLARGISLDTMALIYIYNNSINIRSKNTNGSSALYSHMSSTAYMLNNILYNNGGGYALFVDNTDGINSMNYNDLYTEGLVLVKSGSRSYADLPSWQSASNLDTNSFSVTPLFKSNEDLHTLQVKINNKGFPLSDITDDIDGEPRNDTVPDIGADEFENNTFDLGITSVGLKSGCLLTRHEPFNVTVQNYGGFEVSDFNIGYIINYSDTVTENANAVIEPGTSFEYSFTHPADLSKIKNYHIEAFVTLPGDANSDNDTLVTEITNHPVPDMVVTNDTVICQGEGVTLMAENTSYYSYLWSDNTKYYNIYVRPDTTTAYWVKTTDPNGCSDIDTIQVTVLPVPEKPVIAFEGSPEFCHGGSIELTTDHATGIKWSTGALTQSTLVSKPGNYTVSYWENGCKATSDILTITEEPLPYIESDKLPTICEGDTVNLTVRNALSVNWSTGETINPLQVVPQTTTTYSVTALTPLGCSFEDEMTISLIPASSLPGDITNMLPLDGSSDLDIPLTLSWAPASGAKYYDVYIWPVTQSLPDKPTYANSNDIRQDIDNKGKSVLDYGTTYKWQVISKNGCQVKDGQVHTFSVRELPDLTVENIQVPLLAFSGQNIEMTWKIKNIGNGNTQHQGWYDELLLKTDKLVDDSTVLTKVRNMTYLEPGQSYSKTAVAKLPENITGYYHGIVNIDMTRLLLENNESNNIHYSTDSMWVNLAPPPDLQVTSIVPYQTMFSEQTYPVTWTVTNKGKGKTNTSLWYDRVILSQDINHSKKYILGNFPVIASLEPDTGITIKRNITIPKGIFGKYYIYVETDINNDVLEFAFDGNNTTQSDSVNILLTPPPNLTVSDIRDLPDSIDNTLALTVTWTIENKGSTNELNNSWSDRIYLSKSTNTNFRSTPYQVSYYWNVQGIEHNFSRSASKIISYPVDIPPGYYYVYVETNSNRHVFEREEDIDNNLMRSTDSVYIYVKPGADLQVTNITTIDSSSVARKIPVTYTVQNNGNAGTDVSAWVDKIYFNNGKNPVQLKVVKRNQFLPAGSQYTISDSVNLPNNVNYGSKYYSLVVKTDVENDVYEYLNDNNNTTSVLIFIKSGDLSITSIDVPDTVYTGQTFSANWVIKNKGDAMSPDDKWTDWVQFFYDGSEWENLVTLRIDSGKSYTQNTYIKVPEKVKEGRYRLDFYTDYINDNHEKAAIRSNNQGFDSVYVKYVPPVPPSDLAITSYNIPGSGTVGQSIQITWTVKNESDVKTDVDSWSDKIILSTDQIYSGSDIQLESISRRSGLDPGQSYDTTIKVNLPINTIGNYFVIIVTDAYKKVNDKNRQNNTVASPVNIIQPPPCDLTVSGIDAPSKVTAGDLITIYWTDKNTGVNTAKGAMTDMVYLSKDSAWDANDIYFGELHPYITLFPGNTIQYHLTAEVQGTSVGYYNVIVKTDNLNNIYESNDLNNTLVSSEQIYIDVDSLPLEVVTPATLANNQPVYYRLSIPDSLKDETLIVSLKGDSANGVNELYLRYNDMPTRTEFDYTFENPFAGNQDMVVPELKTGTYYLMVYGVNKIYKQQDITLLASILNFEIRDINSNEGGNTGSITVEIKGSKFTDSIEFRFEGTEDTLVASKLEYIDPSRVFATFDLTDAPLGDYNVLAIKANAETAIRPNGFRVVEASKEGLITYMYCPPKNRYGLPFMMSIQYANSGNTDIPVPTRIIRSLDGAAIGFTTDDLQHGYTELYLEYREQDGPQDVLRPGAIGQVNIYSVCYGEPHQIFEYETYK